MAQGYRTGYSVLFVQSELPFRKPPFPCGHKRQGDMISLHVGEGLLMKFSSTELRTEVKMLVFGELKILIYVMLVSHHCL